MAELTEAEKLRRDIDGLREAINLGWREMADKPMTREERTGLRTEITILVDALHDLLRRLDSMNNADRT